jgi:hypothetical protein
MVFWVAAQAKASKVGTSVNAARTYSLVGLLLAPVVTLGLSTTPAAAQNLAPPSGSIMDLNGLPLNPNDPTSYSTSIVDPIGFQIPTADIVDGATTLTFLFRDDASFINFSNVALYDLSSPTPRVNLLLNGNFSDGDQTQISNGIKYHFIPIDWTYVNPNPTGFFVAGTCSSKPCDGPGQYWRDGTTGSYDELYQSVTVNSQDRYQISFDATVDGPAPGSAQTWASTTTNNGMNFEGNAADILAYLGQVGAPQAISLPPPCMGCDIPIPEPSTWAMMLLGFAGLAFMGYRRASALAS